MDGKSRNPNFGPHASLPGIKEFSEISKRVYEIYHELATHNVLSKLRPTEQLFIRLLYLAESTSYSIRLISSWGQMLQALALGRVRLEQTIVCSYLIHEDISLGLEPYVKYIPINQYKYATGALSKSDISSRVVIDISDFQKEAVTAQEEFTPGFDIKEDKFERKWTKYDLRSMAIRRDELTKNKSDISRDSLERDYLAFYKATSSIIHSDCSALTRTYLDIFLEGETGLLMPNPSWGNISIANLSKNDILQVFEVLTFLDIECEKEFEDLRKNWVALVKKFI